MATTELSLSLGFSSHPLRRGRLFLEPYLTLQLLGGLRGSWKRWLCACALPHSLRERSSNLAAAKRGGTSRVFLFFNCTRASELFITFVACPTSFVLSRALMARRWQEANEAEKEKHEKGRKQVAAGAARVVPSKWRCTCLIFMFVRSEGVSTVFVSIFGDENSRARSRDSVAVIGSLSKLFSIDSHNLNYPVAKMYSRIRQRNYVVRNKCN